MAKKNIESNWITIGLPFLIMFSVGYFYVGLSTLLARWLWAAGPVEAGEAGAREVARVPARVGGPTEGSEW